MHPTHDVATYFVAAHIHRVLLLRITLQAQRQTKRARTTAVQGRRPNTSCCRPNVHSSQAQHSNLFEFMRRAIMTLADDDAWDTCVLNHSEHSQGTCLPRRRANSHTTEPEFALNCGGNWSLHLPLRHNRRSPVQAAFPDFICRWQRRRN